MALYSIWVVEFATSPRVDMGDIVYGIRGKGNRPMPYAYVVLQSKEHVAMVDVGYNHVDFGATLAELYDTVGWHGPAEALALCGVRPKDVDTVFITHAHFDHFGNVEAFPKARFLVSAQEIERSIWALSLPERMQFIATAIDPGDLAKGAALARAGRLELVKEEREDVLPGIDLRLAPDSHSFESLWLHLRNDGRKPSADGWVLAGDLVYAYENIGGTATGAGAGTPYLPVGFAMGSQAHLVLASEAMLKCVDYERRRIVPVHEERVKQMFPSRQIEEGLAITEICLADGMASKVA